MMLSQGKYKGRINSLIFTEINEKPALEFKVTVQYVDQFGEWADIPVENCTVTRYLTPDAIQYVVEDLKNLGFTSTDLEDLETWDCKGKEVPLYCKSKEYNGKSREEWNFNFREKKSDPSVLKSAKKNLNSLFANAMAAKTGGKANPVNSTIGKTPVDNAREFEEAI